MLLCRVRGPDVLPSHPDVPDYFIGLCSSEPP
jgi:hypothetical protein